MARRIPEERFDELVRAATEVFIARGYRLTQMSDIADAIGVAKGTLYGYVESKDTLLALCLAVADQAEPIPLPQTLPMPSLPLGALAERVKEGMVANVHQPLLERAIECPQIEDIAEEARAVIGELYDLMYVNRHRIKLLDRCLDHPDLKDLWQTQGREHSRQALARYVEHRVQTGYFGPVANLRLTARIVLETCATWAVHIHWDRSPESFDPTEARDTTIEVLVRGLLA
jgi:AcrR family transcriptional regulator